MVAREICACLLLELKIEKIQRTWRRYRIRRRWRSRANAATTIQLGVRSHQARKKLRDLRREARDVHLIKKQRDMFREEALRLRRESRSPKETASTKDDAESIEVLRLKNEIAALKSKLSGLEVTPVSTPNSKERGSIYRYQTALSVETRSPVRQYLTSSDLHALPHAIGIPSVVSDSSILNRSLLDDVEEDEDEDIGAPRESHSQLVSPSSTNGIAEFQIDQSHTRRHNEYLAPFSFQGYPTVVSSRGGIRGTPFREQVSAFHRAIAHGEEGLSCSILDESEYCQLLVNESNTNGKSPLHIAVSRGNFHLVQVLLEYGAAANCQDFGGNTPLHFSTNADITGLLLLKGMANPNIPNNDGFCALHVAVSRLDVSSVQILLRSSADINVADNSHWLTPLHLLTSGTDYADLAKHDGGQRSKIAKVLCAWKSPFPVDVNFQDKNGDTPLHNIAILEMEEACDLLRILLENGAQPNLTNSRGQTPLHLLCHNDRLREIGVMQEMLYNMLYHGAKPNIPSQTGCTALHLSLYHRDVDSAVQLMNRGAELHLLWNKVSCLRRFDIAWKLDTHIFLTVSQNDGYLSGKKWAPPTY